jgi:hypothetical protein
MLSARHGSNHFGGLAVLSSPSQVKDVGGTRICKGQPTMMFGMGLVGIVFVVLTVLAVMALVKYLM